jgi:hypothetical protein
VANTPASGGGFVRPQVAISTGLRWRIHRPAQIPGGTTWGVVTVYGVGAESLGRKVFQTKAEAQAEVDRLTKKAQPSDNPE